VEEVVQVEDDERNEDDALGRIDFVFAEECEGPYEARDEQYEDRVEDYVCGG